MQPGGVTSRRGESPVGLGITKETELGEASKCRDFRWMPRAPGRQRENRRGWWKRGSEPAAHARRRAGGPALKRHSLRPGVQLQDCRHGAWAGDEPSRVALAEYVRRKSLKWFQRICGAGSDSFTATTTDLICKCYQHCRADSPISCLGVR